MNIINIKYPITKRGEGVNPIDAHVGNKLRSYRKIAKLSQQDLANMVGITFQQLGKYEKGINRISASRLYQFSKVLGVSINSFFGDCLFCIAEAGE